MRIFDARTANVLATLVLFGLGLGFVYLAWRTLVTFLFAILFAYLLEPLVAELQKRLRFSRARAVAALYFALLILVAIGAITSGPRLAKQAERLSGLAPGLTAEVANGKIVAEVGKSRGWSNATQYRIQQFLAQHHTAIEEGERALVSEVGNVASNAGWVALIPVLAIFFLLSGERFFETMLDQVTRRRQRVFVANLLGDVHDVLAKYIRAQITLTGIALVVYLAAFELMRLQYAVAIGVAVGLLEFIPVIGPLAGAFVVIVAAFLTNYPHLWVLFIFLGAWRVIQDYVNSPRIMGNQVQLDPLAVLFGVLAGAEVAGVIGVYLSIPIMATVRVVWLRWRHFQNSGNLITPAPAGRIPGSDLAPD